MPLEIRQIGIRLQVDEAQGRDGGDAPAPSEPGAGLGQDERAAIVDECVRRVLRELTLARRR